MMFVLRFLRSRWGAFTGTPVAVPYIECRARYGIVEANARHAAVIDVSARY